MIYADADAFVRWEKREFDLPAWLKTHAVGETVKLPATVWQQLHYGAFAWQPDRAQKRAKYLAIIGGVASVAPSERPHAERAARLDAELKRESIGVGDTQIAATALVDGAELLTFNREHFGRVPGLKLVTV